VANRLLNSSKKAKISFEIDVIENHFWEIFEIANDSIHESYDPGGHLNLTKFSVKLETIERTIKTIAIDKSPGLDGIVLRIIRHVLGEQAICNIANIMLNWNYVPLKLCTGRTIFKYIGKGQESDIGNWRPITIFSVLSRIIERSLDQELRSHVKLNSHQKGFVTGIPGTHINASIVNGVLKIAKANKSSDCVVILDITKIFDTVGHNHIKWTLDSPPIPSNLRHLVFSLISGNKITIEANKKSSKPINMLRNVTQGSLLSPTIFNLCQDFVLK